ncbi:ribonuclease P protein component [Rhodocyclus tenuis]|uniref:Ribonuclease P protein component n=1 Tax=Rhodocyclus tenuis TaxID=1066 RepID=A0A840GBR1_RHOTE|nr:ribonuclease P protein component [Rhodocyclus tenuis]MBB4248911.1 ribonuclease P protein component [Rhodocyclus tenuis]
MNAIGPNADPAAPGPLPVTRQSAASAFPKRYRLTKTDEFSSVFGFRRALKSRHFLLHYRLRSTEEVSGARLGLVVAKRFLKRSVDRNLIRRLAREHFRLLRSRLPSRDLVLRLACKPAPLDRRALAQEIDLLLRKLLSER